jgi:hypothetical protein
MRWERKEADIQRIMISATLVALGGLELFLIADFLDGKDHSRISVLAFSSIWLVLASVGFFVMIGKWLGDLVHPVALRYSEQHPRWASAKEM